MSNSVDVASLLNNTNGAPPPGVIPTTPATNKDGSNSNTSAASSGVLTGVDLSKIVSGAFKSFTDSMGLTANAGVALVQAGKNAQAAAQTSQQGITTEAQGKVAETTANEQAAIKLKSDTQNIMTAMGVNPGVAGSTFATYSKAMTDRADQILTDQKELEGRTRVGIFDNPIQWLVNQFDIPFEREKLNTEIASQKTDAETLANLQTNASDQVRLATAADTGASAERLAGQTQQIAGAALSTAATAQEKASQFGLQYSSVRNAIDQDAFNRVMAIHNASVEDANLKLNQGRFEIEEKYKNMQEEYRQEQIDAKNRDAVAQASLQGKLDLATSALGIPKLSYEEYNKLGGALKDQVDRAAIYFGDPTGSAASPARTLSIVNDLNAPMTPGANITRVQLMDQIKPLSSNAEYVNAKPDIKMQMEDQKLIDFANTQHENITPTGNLYSPGSLQSTLAIPMVASTPLAKALEPLAQDKTVPTDFNTIFHTASDLIKNKKASPAEMAAQISQMYQAIAQDVTVTKQFSKFGLPLVGGANGYRVPFSYGQVWRSRDFVDATNKSAVEADLTRMVAQEKYYKGLDITTAIGKSIIGGIPADWSSKGGQQ